MDQTEELQIIYCSNKRCRQVLAETDGEKIRCVEEIPDENRLSGRKKKYNPLYCVHCRQTTRWYKPKFQSRVTKIEKFVSQPKLKKSD